jgi:type I restriction enzyme S subunit
MGSNYKAIGNYIQLVDERNKGLKVNTLLGLSISKQFIKSVANTIGTDMENYKIIRKNQFACSTMQVRRDRKMPVALFIEVVPAIISQAYPIFEIIDTTILLPEYLMMWFTRSEFDREACFHAVGGVRGSLEWEDFCGMKLPIPSPEKQLEIIKEYNTIQNRIQLNNQLITKLEETAQAIYKQWFVDFEFPDTNGKPYKSNGREMVFCEELEKEIPMGWKVGTLGHLCEMIDGDRGLNYPKSEDFFEDEYCLFLNAGNVTKKGFNFSKCAFIKKERDLLLRKGKLQTYDIVLTSRGTVGNLAFNTNKVLYKNIRINSGMLIIRPRLEASYLFSMLNSFEFSKAIENYISGSAVPQLPIKDLSVIQILIPNDIVMDHFSNIGLSLYKNIDIIKNQNLQLEELNELLLARMTKVETEK